MNPFYEKYISENKDWHCDINSNHESSYGLGIFPKGNTLVRVPISAWGCAVDDSYDGKARVWKFKVIKEEIKRKK